LKEQGEKQRGIFFFFGSKKSQKIDLIHKKEEGDKMSMAEE